MLKQIDWSVPTYARGRNGLMKQIGIEIQANDTGSVAHAGTIRIPGIHLRAVTTRNVSFSAELTVPVDQLNQFIAALQEAKGQLLVAGP